MDPIRWKILNEIEQMCATYIEQLCRYQQSIPSLKLNGQNYQWNDRHDNRHRQEFTQYIYVLSVIHRLIRTNNRMNLRELFYSHVNLFHHQRQSDSIVENLAKHFSVDRRQLGFVATAKGLCAGSIQYRNIRTNDLIDCRLSSNGQLIIDDDIEIVENSSPPTFILVVEKDTIFQHLLNDGFLTRYHSSCLITGRGQPDHATRSFLVQLANNYSDIPIYMLTDCDIFGIYIALTYRSALRIDQQHRFRWLGVWPEEIISLSTLNISYTVPITDERERRMINKFIRRNDIDENWQRQVRFFEQHHRKMEIETIYQNGTKSLIDDYLHEKLMGRRWL